MKSGFSKVLRVSSFVALAMLAVACEGGGGGGSTPPKVDPFDALRNNPDVNKNAWFNSMAQICSEGEPRPGCNFRYDGSRITLQADPHYSKLDGFTFSRVAYTDSKTVQRSRQVWDSCDYVDWDGYCVGGYDTEYYTDVETFTNYMVYVNTPDNRIYNVKDWGLNSRFYADKLNGWSFEHRSSGDINDIAILSPTGVKYSYAGNALNAAQVAGGTTGKDVMGSIAEQRADQVKGISEVLQAKFSLDADVSEQAAASLVDWSEIGSKRARTHADMAAFSKRVYGIELGRIEDVALMARDGKMELALKEMDSLVGEAAQNWRTSPETMREVLNFFYGNVMQ
ncbi:MAG: hypothetical protein AB7F59_04715 [Bdellovibrionales bacterium]